MPEWSSSTDPGNGRIVIGRIGRAHGLTGEVVVVSETDSAERLQAGASFWTDGHPPRKLEVHSTRWHAGKLLVRFAGVESRIDAETMQGMGLTIPASARRALRHDEFWPDELIGLTVRDLSGAVIGTIVDVEIGNVQDRLVVLVSGGEPSIVPFVGDLVPEVSIEQGYIVVNPIEGLLNP